MQYIVYILESKSAGKYYIGHTNDVERRLKEHNSSELAKFTKPYQPWVLVYKEACVTRAKAMRLERYLKSLKNKERLRRYIKGWRPGNDTTFSDSPRGPYKNGISRRGGGTVTSGGS